MNTLFDSEHPSVLKLLERIQYANDRLKQLYGSKHKSIDTIDIEKTLNRTDLLSIETDAKTSKGETSGYLTGILYLSPADSFTKINLCPFASKGCKAACLFTAGRGKFYSVTRARIIKTLAFLYDPHMFLSQVAFSIERLKRKAKRLGLIPVVRLNGTSDIDWEKLKRTTNSESIFERFLNVQFYDYTKDIKKVLRDDRPKNYHLTFSLSESNREHFKKLIKSGYNVNTAVVFKNVLPLLFCGIPVINGDKTDLRFTDPKNVIIGLKAKGQAKKDTSGFVRSELCE